MWFSITAADWPIKMSSDLTTTLPCQRGKQIFLTWISHPEYSLACFLLLGSRKLSIDLWVFLVLSHCALHCYRCIGQNTFEMGIFFECVQVPYSAASYIKFNLILSNILRMGQFSRSYSWHPCFTKVIVMMASMSFSSQN